MDTFEEQENPFDTDDNRNLSSEASSSTKLNVSESSPSPTDNYPLPSPSYGGLPQQQKTDHWLQSSDDVEILVRGGVRSTGTEASRLIIATVDRRRAEDVCRIQLPLYYLCYQSRCTYPTPPISFTTPAYPHDQNHEARHRYSEFESLRTHLVKLYPTLIIPPIPSKNTIGDYAVKQAKAKEDAALIARRRRMLQTFLNRIARHPILSNERVFHRFLDGEVSWVR